MIYIYSARCTVMGVVRVSGSSVMVTWILWQLVFCSCVNLIKADYGPLSTSGRWIVNSSGARVKLACMSWGGHMEAMVVEGLDKQRLTDIVDKIGSYGFNCIRLTWATWMFTDSSLGSQTVIQSLGSLNLANAVAGVNEKNPSLANLSLVDAFQRVISALGEANIMVILDNHVSKPQWCCDLTDGNGFWGDQYFNADVWIAGINTVAGLSTKFGNVIGMSLRNEPRGFRQNPSDWRNYMTQGAETVFSVNPNLLVIIAGLKSTTDLSMISSSSPLSFSDERIRSKLVYEMHWYKWTALTHVVGDWDLENGNVACSSDTDRVVTNNGFLLAANQPYTAPMIVSEFGMSMTGASPGELRFMDCLFAYLGEMDLDWAFWALQGSYYLRSGTADYAESFGLVSQDWSNVQNTTFLQKLQAIQKPLQGPSSDSPGNYQKLFHANTGLCVNTASDMTLELADCTDSSSKWSYSGSSSSTGMIVQMGTGNTVIASGAGNSISVASSGADNCAGCQWTLVGQVHYQFQTSVGGTPYCIDGSSRQGALTVQSCLCEHGVQCMNSSTVPGYQWFTFVSEV